MHYSVRPPDVMPVVLGFNYETDNAPAAYKSNTSSTSTNPIAPAHQMLASY